MAEVNVGPNKEDIEHTAWLAKHAEAHPYPCTVREKRRTMNDEEFWADVFGQPDPLDEAAELDQCFGISAPNPCPECGASVACGYDSEGRPMMHIVEDNDG